jgi:hypothetical protein
VSKLEKCGITGTLPKWLSGFIHGRTQCVVIENCFSSFTDVVSGVPQGSDLGLIFFLILLINDIVPSCCGNTTVKLFPDDVKLYSIYNCEDGMLNLQQPVDKRVYWSGPFFCRWRPRCTAVVEAHATGPKVLTQLQLTLT